MGNLSVTKFSIRKIAAIVYGRLRAELVSEGCPNVAVPHCSGLLGRNKVMSHDPEYDCDCHCPFRQKYHKKSSAGGIANVFEPVYSLTFSDKLYDPKPDINRCHIDARAHDPVVRKQPWSFHHEGLRPISWQQRPLLSRHLAPLALTHSYF